MLKEAIREIVSMAENHIHTINGQTYSEKDLIRIPEHVNRPRAITVSSLDSLVRLTMAELTKVHTPVFIQVQDPRTVSVFTTYDQYMARDSLYAATCDVPGFREGWREQEAAIIELRSRFIENEGTAYLLDLLSRIVKKDSVETNDNGVSQTIETRQGISLSQRVSVKPRVSLRPYRTFLEVEQPESEFLLRLDEDGRVGLFEADGGMWKMAAKKSIADCLQGSMEEKVASGEVVVMM